MEYLLHLPSKVVIARDQSLELVNEMFDKKEWENIYYLVSNDLVSNDLSGKSFRAVKAALLELRMSESQQNRIPTTVNISSLNLSINFCKPNTKGAKKKKNNRTK